MLLTSVLGNALVEHLHSTLLTSSSLATSRDALLSWSFYKERRQGRAGKQWTRGHTARNRQSWDWNLGSAHARACIPDHHFPPNTLHFCHLCPCFRCSFYLKKPLLLFLPFLPATWQKSPPPATLWLLYPGSPSGNSQIAWDFSHL